MCLILDTSDFHKSEMTSEKIADFKATTEILNFEANAKRARALTGIDQILFHVAWYDALDESSDEFEVYQLGISICRLLILLALEWQETNCDDARLAELFGHKATAEEKTSSATGVGILLGFQAFLREFLLVKFDAQKTASSEKQIAGLQSECLHALIMYAEHADKAKVAVNLFKILLKTAGRRSDKQSAELMADGWIRCAGLVCLHGLVEAREQMLSAHRGVFLSGVGLEKVAMRAKEANDLVDLLQDLKLTSLEDDRALFELRKHISKHRRAREGIFVESRKRKMFRVAGQFHPKMARAELASDVLPNHVALVSETPPYLVRLVRIKLRRTQLSRRSRPDVDASLVQIQHPGKGADLQLARIAVCFHNDASLRSNNLGDLAGRDANVNAQPCALSTDKSELPAVEIKSEPGIMPSLDGVVSPIELAKSQFGNLYSSKSATPTPPKARRQRPVLNVRMWTRSFPSDFDWRKADLSIKTLDQFEEAIGSMAKKVRSLGINTPSVCQGQHPLDSTHPHVDAEHERDQGR